MGGNKGGGYFVFKVLTGTVHQIQRRGGPGRNGGGGAQNYLGL